MLLSSISTDSWGYVPHIAISLGVVIFAIASLAATEILPPHPFSWRELSRPKTLGAVVLLLMGTLPFAGALVTIFVDPVTTLRPILVELGLVRGAGAVVEKNIRGIWGEPGCAVTYTIILKDGLLTIRSLKSVAGQDPMNIKMEAERGFGNRLVAVVREPLENRGEQHRFIYSEIGGGSREQLTWEIVKRGMPNILDRCEPE